MPRVPVTTSTIEVMTPSGPSRTIVRSERSSSEVATAAYLCLFDDDEREKLLKDTRKMLESDISDTEAYIEDAAERIRQVWDLFREMKPKDIVPDETAFRELKDRFGSPYGFGEYFRGGMGAEAIRDLLEQVDLDAEAEDLEEQVKTAKGQ